MRTSAFAFGSFVIASPMKRQKLLTKALNAPQNMRFAELCSLAEAFGYKLDRVRGSHHKLRARARFPTVEHSERKRKGQAVPGAAIVAWRSFDLAWKGNHERLSHQCLFQRGRRWIYRRRSGPEILFCVWPDAGGSIEGSPCREASMA